MSTSSFIFSSASASGRAIASPVTPMTLTLCCSTRRHVSSASNLSTMTAVLPSNVDAEDRELPGAVHERRDRQADAALRCRGSILSLAAVGVVTRSPLSASMPPAERVVHVFLAPHHALGHAGGAAGVEEVHVVVGALAEVTLGRSCRDGGFELDRFELRVVGVGAVPLDAEEVLELRLRVTRRGDDRPVLPLVHERHEVGVVEEVAQLFLDVAEVDVHDARPGSCRSRTSPRPTRCSSWRGCRRGRPP